MSRYSQPINATYQNLVQRIARGHDPGRAESKRITAAAGKTMVDLVRDVETLQQRAAATRQFARTNNQIREVSR